MLKQNMSLPLTVTFAAGFALMLFFICSSTSAQEYSKLDSVITGKTYKIILFDESEIIGKVMRQDSLTLTVLADNKQKTIVKDDIFNISSNLSLSKYNFILSAGGGISFLIGQNRESSYRGYDPQFSLQLNGMYPFSDSKGIRVDIGFSKFKRNREHYYYYGSGSDITFEGGDMYFYSAKADFIFGLLRPESKFMVYGAVGLGIHVTHNNESIETVYYSWDSTLHTYTNPPQEYIYAALSLGAGAGYKFYRNWGLYLDVQYSILTAYGFFMFGPGYFPLRGGVYYTF